MSSLYTRDSRSKRLSSGGAFEPNPAAARPRRLHLLRRGRLPALLAAGWDAALRRSHRGQRAGGTIGRLGAGRDDGRGRAGPGRPRAGEQID